MHGSPVLETYWVMNHTISSMGAFFSAGRSFRSVGKVCNTTTPMAASLIAHRTSDTENKKTTILRTVGNVSHDLAV